MRILSENEARQLVRSLGGQLFVGLPSGVESSAIAFAITDSAGRRTWLECDFSGKPTVRVVEILRDAAGLGEIDAQAAGLSFAITDAVGRRTDLELDLAGHVPDRVLDLWKARMNLAGASASGPGITCWGDSMTAGAGATNGNTYPTRLAYYTGLTCTNRGVGGETSVTIAARANGVPLQYIPTGGTIAADTSAVTLTEVSLNGQPARPLLQGATTLKGYFGGVYGTLNLVEPNGNSSSWDNANYYTFARDVAGDAVPLTRPTPFYTDHGDAARGDVAIIWIGQNGPSEARAQADAAAIIQRMSALNKRFLVISKPTSTDAQDSVWHDLYGRRFVAIRKYLVTYGLADAGLTATSQDNTDIAAGTVPTSLRVDSVHFNSHGYNILGYQLNLRLRELYPELPFGPVLPYANVTL